MGWLLDDGVAIEEEGEGPGRQDLAGRAWGALYKGMPIECYSIGLCR